MKDRSQIVMLIGLAALMLAVLTLAPSVFSIGPVFWAGGPFPLPWVLIAVAFWFIFGKRGGCCCRRARSEKV